MFYKGSTCQHKKILKNLKFKKKNLVKSINDKPMANIKLSAENWKISLKFEKTLVKSWAQTHSKGIRQEKTHKSLEIQIKMEGE